MDVAWLDKVLAAAGLPSSVAVSAMDGGTFNTVLQVATGDVDVVVKVAPDPAIPVLAYEHGIMATEAAYYRLATEHGITSVPRTLYHGTVDGTEALVLSLCPGQPWPSVELSAEQRRALRAAVGQEIAGLHTITGPGFGYPARPLATSWREAFTGMVDALLDDAQHFGVALPRPAAAIAAAVDRAGPALDTVDTPALVHFDLWDGNILVTPERRLGGLIDAERAFWGDPAAELVSLCLLGDVDDEDGLLAGYRAAGGRLDLDEATRLRLRVYRLYLYLIMWVEVAPRGYDESRISWLRNAVLGPAIEIVDDLS